MYWTDMRPLSVKITSPLRSLPSIFGTLAPLASKLSNETSVQVPRSCSLSVLVWAVTDWAATASPKTAAADKQRMLRRFIATSPMYNVTMPDRRVCWLGRPIDREDDWPGESVNACRRHRRRPLAERRLRHVPFNGSSVNG